MNRDQRRIVDLLIESFETKLLYWAEQEANEQLGRRKSDADESLNQTMKARAELGRYLDSLTER